MGQTNVDFVEKPLQNEVLLEGSARSRLVEAWTETIRDRLRKNPDWIKQWLKAYGPEVLQILSDTQLEALMGVATTYFRQDVFRGRRRNKSKGKIGRILLRLTQAHINPSRFLFHYRTVRNVKCINKKKLKSEIEAYLRNPQPKIYKNTPLRNIHLPGDAAADLGRNRPQSSQYPESEQSPEWVKHLDMFFDEILDESDMDEEVMTAVRATALQATAEEAVTASKARVRERFPSIYSASATAASSSRATRTLGPRLHRRRTGDAIRIYPVTLAQAVRLADARRAAAARSTAPPVGDIAAINRVLEGISAEQARADPAQPAEEAVELIDVEIGGDAGDEEDDVPAVPILLDVADTQPTGEEGSGNSGDLDVANTSEIASENEHENESAPSADGQTAAEDNAIDGARNTSFDRPVNPPTPPEEQEPAEDNKTALTPQNSVRSSAAEVAIDPSSLVTPPKEEGTSDRLPSPSAGVETETASHNHTDHTTPDVLTDDLDPEQNPSIDTPRDMLFSNDSRPPFVSSVSRAIPSAYDDNEYQAARAQMMSLLDSPTDTNTALDPTSKPDAAQEVNVQNATKRKADTESDEQLPLPKKAGTDSSIESRPIVPEISPNPAVLENKRKREEDGEPPASKKARTDDYDTARSIPTMAQSTPAVASKKRKHEDEEGQHTSKKARIDTDNQEVSASESNGLDDAASAIPQLDGAFDEPFPTSEGLDHDILFILQFDGAFDELPSTSEILDDNTLSLPQFDGAFDGLRPRRKRRNPSFEKGRPLSERITLHPAKRTILDTSDESHGGLLVPLPLRVPRPETLSAANSITLPLRPRLTPSGPDGAVFQASNGFFRNGFGAPTDWPMNRYEDGEVRRYGAGESYRPFNRDRSPPPRGIRSPIRDRGRTPPGASDSYVPGRSPRRRSRSIDRFRRERSRDRDVPERWRRSRSRARTPIRRASPPRRSPIRRTPPRYVSPRRDDRRDDRSDRARSPLRRDFEIRDIRYVYTKHLVLIKPC